MRTLLNPKWLWLLNTLPLVLLLALLGAEYSIIETLLPPESRQLWRWVGAGLVVLGGLHAGYAVWQWRRARLLSVAYAVGALAVYIAFLYAYGYHLTELLPPGIPRWMVPGDLPLYAGTFLMPTLAHAAAVLVLRFTPEAQPHNALPNFGVALAVPIGWYAFAQLVMPLWHSGGGEIGQHILVVVLIIGTLVFLLALARGVYIIVARQKTGWVRFQWVWKLLVAGVLPLLGLAVNNGVLFQTLGLLGMSTGGIFGDFTGPWWYGLAGLNAVLLLLPAPAGPRLRLALYLGRSIMLGYTLYFFVVFLPFLPLSVVAVAAVGVGFLLLTPLVLFVVHLRVLAEDYAALRMFFAGRWLALGLVAALAVLPLAVTLHYYHHRVVLRSALDYVYAPNYTRPYEPLDTKTLAATLAVVRHHKEKHKASLTGAQLPYLSTYFNWLVLDNLTLSETKLQLLEQIFFGREDALVPQPVAPDLATRAAHPALTRLTARSRYDATQQAWVSWVDLTVANANSADSFAEYATTFELPAGCFISNYYLDMEGRRELGILAEKRAATWVYSQIRNESRDPGLLHYLSGNRVALRVFPFTARQVRRTGIQLLHKDPLAFTIDGQTVALGNSGAPVAASAVSPPVVSSPPADVTYVSATEKAMLPVVRRRPYYHFVLDVSRENARHLGRYQRQIEALLARPGGSNNKARISVVGTYVTTLPIDSLRHLPLAAQRKGGGFYLDRAIRQILVQAAEKPENRYPVIVVVSPAFDAAILLTDFADLRHAYPENDVFYELTENSQLLAHSLPTNSAARGGSSLLPAAAHAVVAWPNAQQPAAYLPANNQPDLIMRNLRLPVLETAIRQRDWRSGLLLQKLWRTQLHHPETADAVGSQLINYSFHSTILTPLTAYLALENDAQKAALRRKQEQLLAGHAALDAGEDEQRMSEPSEWLLAALVVGLLGWHWLRTRRVVGATV